MFEKLQRVFFGAVGNDSHGRTRTTALLAAVGLALFLSAVWTARNENALVSDYGLYAARFVVVPAPKACGGSKRFGTSFSIWRYYACEQGTHAGVSFG